MDRHFPAVQALAVERHQGWGFEPPLVGQHVGPLGDAKRHVQHAFHAELEDVLRLGQGPFVMKRMAREDLPAAGAAAVIVVAVDVVHSRHVRVQLGVEPGADAEPARAAERLPHPRGTQGVLGFLEVGVVQLEVEPKLVTGAGHLLRLDLVQFPDPQSLHGCVGQPLIAPQIVAPSRREFFLGTILIQKPVGPEPVELLGVVRRDAVDRVEEHAVFVCHFDLGDGRVLAVHLVAAIWIAMGHDRSLQRDVGLHHSLVEESDTDRIEHRIFAGPALAVRLLIGKRHGLVERVDAVALLELAIPQEAGAAVDPVLGQFGNEVIQLVHDLRVEMPAVRPAPVDGRVPFRARHQVADPYQVETVLGQPASHVGGFLFVPRRTLHGGHKPCGRAVVEHPPPVNGFQEPVLARRGIERCGLVDGRRLEGVFHHFHREPLAAVERFQIALHVLGRRDILRSEKADGLVGCGDRRDHDDAVRLKALEFDPLNDLFRMWVVPTEDHQPYVVRLRIGNVDRRPVLGPVRRIPPVHDLFLVAYGNLRGGAIGVMDHVVAHVAGRPRSGVEEVQAASLAVEFRLGRGWTGRELLRTKGQHSFPLVAGRIDQLEGNAQQRSSPHLDLPQIVVTLVGPTPLSVAPDLVAPIPIHDRLQVERLKPGIGGRGNQPAAQSYGHESSPRANDRTYRCQHFQQLHRSVLSKTS